MMKCHYEVLNIDREADESEIKTAYRKCALKWHPDKNLNDPDQAKEQFQLVQQAYEVLSDHQERAWYDNHREQILCGANNKEKYRDSSLDVFPYFTSSCFKGYTDDKEGFYQVYRTVFEKIATEDIEYMDSELEFDLVPRFGDSTSEYDTIVGPFYSYWMSYSTKKSYVWLDPYDIRETRSKDRKIVKLIERENKKVRAKARKDRNEEVRNLVAFVRKRDKRVQAHNKLLEIKAIENRKKQEDMRRLKILERTKELNEATQNEQEWSKFENMSSELKEIEKNLAAEFGENLSESESSLDSDGGYEDTLYCISCNKLFKTEKAFQNHESSKKHRENSDRLKLEMTQKDEDIHCALERPADDKVNAENADADTNVNICEEELAEASDDFCDKPKKKNKSRKKKNQITMASTDEEYVDLEIGLSKKQKKRNQREQTLLASKKIVETGVIEAVEIDEDVLSENVSVDVTPKIDTTPEKNITTNSTTVKGSKKKNKTTLNDNSSIDTSLSCGVCKSNFPSKNKLFDHLKKTGHSIALPEKSKVPNPKSSKRKASK